METKIEIINNPLFPALQKVGHTPEQDIFVWSMGLGFHNHNLLTALEENVKDADIREKILTSIWKYFYSVGLERPNQVLGVQETPDLAHLNKIMTDVMGDAQHPAILKMGDTVEEAILNWVKSFAIYDFAVYTYLEKYLGAKEGLRLYMGLWETFALAELDNVKAALGINDSTDITIDILGKLSQIYWESIACPYNVTIHTADIHEAEIEVCPYWENMKTILGEPVCRSMTLKAETATSVNYYDAILKALGVFDRYSFTMDKFACCGDDRCRIRFERR
jgi:hypothetical protein